MTLIVSSRWPLSREEDLSWFMELVVVFIISRSLSAILSPPFKFCPIEKGVLDYIPSLVPFAGAAQG